MTCRKYILTILLSVMASLLIKPAHAEAYYSTKSLKLLCAENAPDELACLTYLHGVVETWALKDVVSVEPYRYRKHSNGTTFCTAIDKVSDQEWLRIVRSNFNTMESGFAAGDVMKALSEKLCN